jgi:hypothetical protein
VEELERQHAWKQVKKSMDVGFKRNKIVRWSIGIAASLVLIAALGSLLFHPGKVAVLEPAVYTAAETNLKVKLGQASEIDLHPGSELTVINQSHIRLKGSALFYIAHDTLHPLIVETGSLIVNDIGTVFTITTSSDTVVVKVAEGKVTVSANHESVVEVIAGEKAIYLPSTKKLEVIRQQKGTAKIAPPKNAAPEIPKAGNTPAKIPADTIKGRTDRGIVIFECSKCAEKGQLQLLYGSETESEKRNFMFNNFPAPDVLRHTESLRPGEYKWFYNDGRRNKDSGTITVTGGREQVIRLLQH